MKVQNSTFIILRVPYCCAIEPAVYVTITAPEHIKKEMAKKLEDVRKRYE